MKISILEDYHALGHLLQLSLELAGHTVQSSETVLEFLMSVNTPVPADLIIVDFYLLAEGTEVQLSGVDVIRHVRTTSPNVPAILISAAPLATLQAAAAGLPRVTIIRKPFRTSFLLETIQSIKHE